MLGGVQLVYAGHLMLACRFVLDRRIDKCVTFIFSIVDGSWSVCVCMCFTYTHTHTARGVLGCEPLGMPEQSRWTESQESSVLCRARGLEGTL